MYLVRGLKEVLGRHTGGVLTIGNFDGVHLGHQFILKEVMDRAKKAEVPSLVFSFRPHPRAILAPDLRLEFLSTYSERRDHLEAAGINAFIEEPFSRSFSNTSYEVFFRELREVLQPRQIVVGHDFAFGKDRNGSVESLKGLCKEVGVTFFQVAPQSIRTESGSESIVSSTKIREALLRREVFLASQLLGYSFYYRGHVVKGDQRGSEIGFPTANLRSGMKLTLPYGVYATQSTVMGKKFPSVTNVGIRPTFDRSEPVIETHLLDTTLDLYGQELKVEFIGALRSEQKFPSLDSLRVQIGKDILQARKMLS